jgi:hypothetical protein
MATWIFNVWLYLMSIYAPSTYAAMVAAGEQWYTCVEWDANGHSHPSAACTEPPPAFVLAVPREPQSFEVRHR